MRARLPPAWTLYPAPFVGWGLFQITRGELRWEFIALMILTPILTFAGPRSRRFMALAFPLALVGVLYDATRFVHDVGVTEARVHVCDLRAFELTLFGIGRGAARVTIPEWFQGHTSLAADVFCSIPYGAYLFVVAGYGVYLYRKDVEALRSYSWGFFALNMLGFLTYHLYPAAPPWYWATHGCSVDLWAHASEGPNLARVDQWSGTTYFHAFYGRAREVFGAIPSLHVAYPLLIVFNGWRLHGRLGRTLALGYFVWMAFAALYLFHHWLIDLVIGVVYMFVAHVVVRACLGLRENVVPPAPLSVPEQGGE